MNSGQVDGLGLGEHLDEPLRVVLVWEVAGVAEQFALEVAAKDKAGATISGYVAVAGVISGLQFSSSGTTFLVGGANVSPADIVSING